MTIAKDEVACAMKMILTDICFLILYKIAIYMYLGKIYMLQQVDASLIWKLEFHCNLTFFVIQPAICDTRSHDNLLTETMMDQKYM